MFFLFFKHGKMTQLFSNSKFLKLIGKGIYVILLFQT